MPAVNLSPLTFRSDALQLLGRDGKKDAKQEREKNRKKQLWRLYKHTVQMYHSFSIHVQFLM